MEGINRFKFPFQSRAVTKYLSQPMRKGGGGGGVMSIFPKMTSAFLRALVLRSMAKKTE